MAWGGVSFVHASPNSLVEPLDFCGFWGDPGVLR